MGRTHAGAVWEELQPVGRTHTGEACGELSHTGEGAECEESSPEEEGVAETACDELNATLVPHPPALLEGRRERIQE